jgi:hypothetical protein
MNVRLEYVTEFLAGVVYNGMYTINHYLLTFNLVTNTVDPTEQNVAFDRARHWISQIINNSVLIDADDKAISVYQQTGQRVIAIPGGPLDQLVLILLFKKLNAITEGRMIVTDAKLSSSMGDNVVYLLSDDEDMSVFAHDGWWSLPSMQYYTPSKKKVLAFTPTQNWESVDLGWEETQDTNDTHNASVVFADFTHNDKK